MNLFTNCSQVNARTEYRRQSQSLALPLAEF